MSKKNIFSTKKNILWVDDHINNPALEPDMDELKERNCTIIGVPKAEDFLKIIRDNTYHVDCIIIDSMMPNGTKLSLNETANATRTGLALIKILCKSVNYKEVPIIVYSVLPESEIKDYCSENDIPLNRVTILKKTCPSKVFANEIVNIVSNEKKKK